VSGDATPRLLPGERRVTKQSELNKRAHIFWSWFSTRPVQTSVHPRDGLYSDVSRFLSQLFVGFVLRFLLPQSPFCPGPRHGHSHPRTSVRRVLGSTPHILRRRVDIVSPRGCLEDVSRMARGYLEDISWISRGHLVDTRVMRSQVTDRLAFLVLTNKLVSRIMDSATVKVPSHSYSQPKFLHYFSELSG